jgi:hypothetical protein
MHINLAIQKKLLYFIFRVTERCLRTPRIGSYGRLVPYPTVWEGVGRRREMFLAKHQPSALGMFDLSAAFDRIDHTTLLD